MVKFYSDTSHSSPIVAPISNMYIQCHTNGGSIKNMIGVVVNRLVGMGL